MANNKAAPQPFGWEAMIGTAGFACGRRSPGLENGLAILGFIDHLEQSAASSAIRP
jgi:hypothetical protein